MRRVLVAVTVLLAVVLSVDLASGADASEIPQFPNLTLLSVDGSTRIDLESLRGRPVLLTFWASWCGPCRMELPELQKLADELKDEGLALVTVNMDQSPAMGMKFLERNSINVPVFLMSSSDLRALGVGSLPTNVLLDRDGRPAQIFEGYSPEVPAEIRRLVLSMDGGAAKPGPTSAR
jgi:thiol-disulfide isomerase/thioredoxin